MTSDPHPLPTTPPGPARRAITVLLALVMIGMPLIIAFDLAALRETAPAFRGNQPGGPVRGRILGPDGGALGGIGVRLHATTSGAPLLVETTSAADGTYALEAPPLTNAAYRLRTGGGPWRLMDREVGFLAPDGPLVGDTLEHDVTLKPGAVLRIDLAREDGLPSPGGTVRLRGEWVETGAMRLAPRILDMERSFEGTPIVLDGLPPLDGRVDLVLAGGRTVTFEVALREGEQQQRVDL